VSRKERVDSQARVNTALEFAAWIGKRRLGDCVVLGSKGEKDFVAHVRRLEMGGESR